MGFKKDSKSKIFIKTKPLSPFVTQLSNQKGGVLVLALVGAASVLIVMVLVGQNIFHNKKVLRSLIIRSYVTQYQQRLADFLLNPNSYSFSGSNPVAQLNTDLLGTTFQTLPGSGPECPQSLCQIKVIQKDTLPLWDAALGTFRGLIVYTGNDTNIAPLEFSIEVPKDLLQNLNFFCAEGAPLFSGFNADGSLNCKAFQGPLSCADTAGSFLWSTNNKLQATCGNFSQTISCPITSFIPAPGPSWDSSKQFSGWTPNGCQDRLNPYTNPELTP